MKKLIYILVCLSVFTCTSASYSQNLLEEFQKALANAAEKREEELKKNTISVGESIVLGGIEFEPIEVVAFKNTSGELAYLSLYYVIENITETQVIKLPQFRKWSFQYIEIEDNFGNDIEIFGDIEILVDTVKKYEDIKGSPIYNKWYSILNFTVNHLNSVSASDKRSAFIKWKSPEELEQTWGWKPPEELLPKESIRQVIITAPPKVGKAISFNLKLKLFVDNKNTKEKVAVVFKKSDIREVKLADIVQKDQRNTKKELPHFVEIERGVTKQITIEIPGAP